MATKLPMSLPAAEPGTSILDRSKIVSFVNEQAFWSSRNKEADCARSPALRVWALWSPQIVKASWTANAHGARSVLSSESTPRSLDVSEAREVGTGRSVMMVMAKTTAMTAPTIVARRRYHGGRGGVDVSLMMRPVCQRTKQWRCPTGRPRRRTAKTTRRGSHWQMAWLRIAPCLGGR